MGQRSSQKVSVKEIALMLDNKSNGLDIDIDRIEAIISNMNSRRSFLEKWTYLSKSLLTALNPHWLQAFIDAEGSFQFGIGRKL
jgi:hypothetical protein